MTWFVAIGKSSFAYKFSYTLARREFPGIATGIITTPMCVSATSRVTAILFSQALYILSKEKRE
ncbi:MAG TPA: hypothetical protein PLZ76_00745, partial [Bacillota bacterium]|nr:hypothetical protein [Bacillota bacterium]